MVDGMKASRVEPPPPVLVEDTETGEGPLPSPSPEGSNRKYCLGRGGFLVARASRRAYEGSFSAMTSTTVVIRLGVALSKLTYQL
jgi:hypothetical protein